MGLFRRGQTPSTSPAPAEVDPALLGPDLPIVGYGFNTDIDPAKPVAIDAYLEPDQLIQNAEQYIDAWNTIDAVVERLDFTAVISNFGDNVRSLREDGSGRLENRRKIKREERDSVLMTALSAHVAALPRDDSEYYPFLFSYSDDDYDMDEPSDVESLAIFSEMRDRAAYLQTLFETVENSSGRVLLPVVRFLQDGGDVDELISWLRDQSTSAEMVKVMQILAQDILDPSRGSIEEAILGRIETDDTPEARVRLAETLEYRDEGDFQEEIDILNLALRGLSDRRIDVQLTEFIRDLSLPYSEWPKALRETYTKIRQDRVKEIKAELQKISSNYFVRSRRRAMVEDLQRLEKSLINTPEEMEAAARSGRLPKKTRAKIPHDYVDPPSKEVEPPKQAPVSWVKIDDSRSRTISAELAEEQDDDALSTQLLETFASKNKLDTNQRNTAHKDIKKMIQALRMRATGNYGVTKIAEVKPFRDGSNRNHDIWRLNPAHYNGLSVSRMGKDMRLIYTLSGSGEVGIIGVYTHDDYTAMLKQLQ